MSDDIELELARERDVNVPGGGHDLRNYWVHGPGAIKIGWGTDGSFARCVAQLGRHVSRPQGLCAEYHKAATGEWPAEKGVESGSELIYFADISQEERERLAQEGKALPDGSYPIRNTKDLSDAIQAIGRAKDRGRALAFIKKRARELKATGNLPDGWSVMEAFDIVDDHGHRHGKDGKFVDNPLKGMLDVTPDQFEATKSRLSREGRAKYKPGPPIANDDPLLNRRSNDYDEEDGPTRAENITRMHELEDQADSDQGLSGTESAELKKLRRLYGSNDFALTAASKKKKVEEMQTYADEPWEGVLGVEGVESGDSRLFGMGSLDWAELPMPLQYQPTNIGGHNGSVTVGEITHIARYANEIHGWGNIFGASLAGEHGEGIRNTMNVGGVSVDVDKVKDADVELVFADAEDGGNPFAKPETTIFHRGRVRGATLVPFPAFVEAKLKFTGALKASATLAVEDENCGCDSTVLTASSHTITIPNLPPAHWFNEPTDVVSTGALTITDEGRVFGVVAPADTTHRSVKTKVPRNLDFSRFLKGETIVEGGGRVVTGVITASCGHAATQNYGTLNDRIEHYDNSCSVLANVRVGYARDGAIWVGGALNPGADPSQVAQALGCALSLDVQPHPDRAGIREFIAAHLVPVPGFPLARTKASVLYNDGVITAASVPVNFTDTPVAASFDMYHLVRSTKQALAESIGRDPASRKRELAKSLGR